MPVSLQRFPVQSYPLIADKLQHIGFVNAVTLIRCTLLDINALPDNNLRFRDLAECSLFSGRELLVSLRRPLTAGPRLADGPPRT